MIALLDRLKRNWLPAAAGFGFAICGSSCEVHQVDSAPKPAATGVSRPTRPPATGRWWADFSSSNLSRLIEASLKDNPDVRAVSRRIDQANEERRQAGAPLFPRIGGSADRDVRWNRVGDREQSSSIGFLLDWELDVWGRIRSGQAARGKEAEAAIEDWRAARLLLSASVAETWFELAEQRGQLKLAYEQIESNEVLLRLTRVRAGQGQGSAVAVLQQEEQLQSIETRVPDLELRIETLELALDALAGRLPKERSRGGSMELRNPPALPTTGVRSDLLVDRPDLRAREARIIAFDYEVGEAIADCLPRFTIGGSLSGAGTPGIEALIGDAIAGAVVPVFEAGSRRAEVEKRRARVEEEVDRYTADYLAAVRDVEIALAREAKLAERVRLLERQLETARKLLTESRQRFIDGGSVYLPVLDAVSKVQQLERDLLTGRRERLGARVALHRALGGPMPNANPK
ncbi:MAG: efflux transporter outer membrane subunit [Verrucomicrobiota bacterium]